MNLSCALVFLFVINIASGYTICRDWTRWSENEDETRNIIGGTPIKADGDFPYLVSIFYEGKHFCGGSILNERYILTAAHCVIDRDRDLFSILYGKVDIGSTGPNFVRIKNYRVHYNYVYNENYTTPHDIAVIELQEDIKFGIHASPVSLPYQDEVIPETDDMLIMGWGRTEHGTHPIHALYAIVSKHNDDYCVRRGVNIQYSYCGGLYEGGRGVCDGDSGGPAMINGKQYGVVSGAPRPCAISRSYETYTRIPFYRLWIKKHTGV